MFNSTSARFLLCSRVPLDWIPGPCRRSTIFPKPIRIRVLHDDLRSSSSGSSRLSHHRCRRRPHRRSLGRSAGRPVGQSSFSLSLPPSSSSFSSSLSLVAVLVRDPGGRQSVGICSVLLSLSLCRTHQHKPNWLPGQGKLAVWKAPILVYLPPGRHPKMWDK